jgi:hypothetical protein
VPFGDLVSRARAAVSATGDDPAAHGLARLVGGMTHHVFEPLDDTNLVVKVFESNGRAEPENEWNALVTCAGTGVLSPSTSTLATSRLL